MRLGAHESISGGIHKSFERCVSDGGECMQIFTKNANQWKGKKLTEEDKKKFIEERKRTNIYPVAAHDSYLINLAEPKEEKWNRAKEAFIEEAQRASFLELEMLIFHPGGHLGSGEKAGIQRVSQAISETLERMNGWHVELCIETTAGQGSSLGCTFEQINSIIEMVHKTTGKKPSVCFDTCHTFAAGYDIRSASSFENVLKTFDNIIGLDRLKVFHLNDSKKGLGSRIDRHENIGKGEIGIEAFNFLVNERRFESLPGILETPPLPSGEESFALNLKILKNLRKK